MLIGHQRFIYNAKTQEQDYWFKFYKQSLSLTGLSYYPDQSYSQFRNRIKACGEYVRYKGY